MDTQSAARVLQSVPGVQVVGILSSPSWNFQCAPVLLTQLGPEGFRSVRDDLVRKARELAAPLFRPEKRVTGFLVPHLSRSPFSISSNSLTLKFPASRLKLQKGTPIPWWPL